MVGSEPTAAVTENTRASIDDASGEYVMTRR